MKIKIYVAVCCLITLFVACGPKGFSITYKGKSVPFEKKTAAASFRPDLQEGQIVLTNYDVEIKDKSVMGVADPTTVGQMLVGFGFKTNSDDFKEPVKPGEFTDTIKYVWVSNGDTKDRVDFRTDGKVKGKITVTEVTADTIKGTIDVTKDDSSVSGTFEAKILSKHL